MRQEQPRSSSTLLGPGPDIPPPDLTQFRRARLGLRFEEVGEPPQQVFEEGWALIDGPWVLWLSDEAEGFGWQSWPSHNVLCIEWRADDASG